MEDRLCFLEKMCTEQRTANIDRTTGEFLAFLMQLVRPHKVLEIGTSTGYSALWLSSSGAEVHTLEKREDRVAVALQSFEGRNIILHKGDALEIIPTLDGPFDVLFLDATKREYLQYFLLASKKLSEGALVVADNTLSHASKMQDFLKFVREKYAAVTLPMGKGLTVFVFSELNFMNLTHKTP